MPDFLNIFVPIVSLEALFSFVSCLSGALRDEAKHVCEGDYLYLQFNTRLFEPSANLTKLQAAVPHFLRNTK